MPDGPVRGTVTGATVRVLRTGDAVAKARAARQLYADWGAGHLPDMGQVAPPLRPARPDRPERLAPRDMPKRRKAGTQATRIALIHSIAHIELNAIDLACDLVARFADRDLPVAFVEDWLRVADDEARHFMLLRDRLQALGADYGDLPAHDGLWEAAMATAGDLHARLAVAHMVLEARGLDVTPDMIVRLRRQGDSDTADVLQVIYQDEIGHVAAASRWFRTLSGRTGTDLDAYWQGLVRRHFRGVLKPPFNEEARRAAGMEPALYVPVSAGNGS